MSGPAEKLKRELAQLPALDRAALAHFLIQSLENAPDADAESEWDAELQRRADEILSGNAKSEPADKVFKDLRDRFS